MPNLFAIGRLALVCTLALSSPLRAATADEAPNPEQLFAFVGSKISVTLNPVPPCTDCMFMDQRYAASYRVLKSVFGDYRDETITFDVYDHYGVPAFSKFDTALLFVSKQEDGTWVHEKYLYVDLYKATDGQWYGCGDPYRSSAFEARTVHAKPVQFLDPVSYSLAGMDRSHIRRFYPAKYFQIRKGRAYCLLGTSVDDLFQAHKETVLAARGYFEKPRQE